jgi:chemotaxis response regulator CheB
LADRKKILVLESEQLLATGIFSMLAARPEFLVTKTAVSSLASLDLSGSLQPDVVILEEGILAANILAVISLTNCLRNLRLIVFKLSDTTIHVFDKQTIQVRCISDFTELL